MSSNITIDQTTETTTESASKRAAVNALATVGFIALLIIGITLAIYSARYIPLAVSKLSGIATSSSTPNTLTVVTSSSTAAYGNGAGTLIDTNTTTALTPPSTPTLDTSVTPAATPKATSAPVAAAHPRGLYGLPDLSVTIIATGYLASDSTASFVPASIIPPGARPAVQFSIANDGTNATGPWNFLAQIPTYNGSVFNSPIEPSLNPGDHTVFTLGFNEAIPGPAQTITVVADPNDNIVESNEGNNSAAAAVTITATGN